MAELPERLSTALADRYCLERELGQGGMATVYLAQDLRHGRKVAIKVLKPELAAVLGAERFVQEITTTAQLQHPHILPLFDSGSADGFLYYVMPYIEGETLRTRLDREHQLGIAEAVRLTTEVADALDYAHRHGVIHRDIKPENILLHDGRPVVADFGIALAVSAAAGGRMTETGLSLGTPHYMSPEQATAERELTARSDVYSLASVLYEMLTGNPPHVGATAQQIIMKIIGGDVAPVTALRKAVPPNIAAALNKALEKLPADRFDSARAFAAALLDPHYTGPASAESNTGATARQWKRIALGAGVAVLALGAATTWVTVRLLSGNGASHAVRYTQLTYEDGMVSDARFTPDGQSVIYSAAWDGRPLRVFMTRLDAQQSVPLPLPDARLLSLSRSGEMALSLGHAYEGWMGSGTLARSSVLGGAPRVLLDHVREAEWTPDGSELAVVRRVNGLEQLELPAGHVLYRTSGWISDVRFSPDGEHIAFADHTEFGDDAGGISVVDRSGRRTPLAGGYTAVRGLAWSRDNREIWFAADRAGTPGTEGNALIATTLAGRQRTILTTPSPMKLLDLAPDGRVLMSNITPDSRTESLLAGSNEPVEVTLHSQRTSGWISDDGTMLTMSDWSAPRYAAYLLKAGGEPTLLGDGQAYGVSDDGRWCLAVPLAGAPILLHPTGAGETRTLSNPQQVRVNSAAWLPDGRHVIIFGAPHGQPERGYVQDIDGGAPRAFTPAGATVSAVRWWAIPISPDGTRVIALDANGLPTIYRISDGHSEPVPGMDAEDVPIRWSADGRSLFAVRGFERPRRIDRVDVATGHRTPALEIGARERAGLFHSVIALPSDGRHYVHSYLRRLSDLFLVQGLESRN